jgi:hypothetical protein
MKDERKVYKILVRKPEEKRPLGRPGRRWKYGIGMAVWEIGWGAWSGFTWLRAGTGGGLSLMQ